MNYSSYNPMQYSLARTNVVGRTAENIGMSIINTVSNIDKMVQQKDAEKKFNIAYAETLKEFGKQVNQIDPNISVEEGAIKARHFYKNYEGLPLADRIKMFASGEIPAQKYLEKLGEKKTARESAAAAQSAVQGGRKYSLERDTGQGFTEQDITETAPPARYQEEAIGTYGKMASEGEVPIQSAKQLKEQPSIAALPERPEPQKPMTEYQKAMVKLKEEANEIARLRAKRQAKSNQEDLLKRRDENIKWSRTQRRLMDGNTARYKNYVTTIEKVINKINKDKADGAFPTIDMEDREKLMAAGISEAEMTSVERLDQIQNEYEKLAEKSSTESKEFANMEKFLRQKGPTATISEGFTFAEEKTEEQKLLTEQQEKETLQKAANYIRTNIPVDTIKNGTMDQIIDMLPPMYQDVMKKKVEEAKAEGFIDVEIRRKFGQGL